MNVGEKQREEKERYKCGGIWERSPSIGHSRFALEPEAWKSSEYIAAVTHMTMYVQRRERMHTSSLVLRLLSRTVFECRSCVIHALFDAASFSISIPRYSWSVLVCRCFRNNKPRFAICLFRWPLAGRAQKPLSHALSWPLIYNSSCHGLWLAIQLFRIARTILQRDVSKISDTRSRKNSTLFLPSRNFFSLFANAIFLRSSDQLKFI